MSTTTHDTSHTNRLAGESSPYLLLHQHNPVDWYPWGPEALEKARREDKPIFLSVGYSTCYWCHVMERESFSDPETAELMNREFVNIKLDREERPDLDEIYMTATQILAEQGGWPNSVFLTPELKPFYAGTYFPPDDRYGRPGFRHVLEDLATAWRTRRPDVNEQAEEVARAMGRYLEEPRPSRARAARRRRDLPGSRLPRPAASTAQWGGFGSAPKFPTPSNLYLLLELVEEREEAGQMLTATLDQMARGGIYDQLGGGFHRYATDREWKIPHFEKMLYDNGFLLELYAREHARTGDPQAARIVRETAAWVEREMTSPEGAFWSAIDAETHGHEGAFYVWTVEELREVLGEEDFTFLAPHPGLRRTPFLRGDPLRPPFPGEAGGRGAAPPDGPGGADPRGRRRPGQAVRRPVEAGAPVDGRQGPGGLERHVDHGPRRGGQAPGRARLRGAGGPGGGFRPADDASRGRYPAPFLARGAGEDRGLSRRLRLPGPRPPRPS